MALVKPGVWHDTVWADRTWPADLWLEHGTAVTGGDSARYYYMRVYPFLEHEKRRKELLVTVKTLLETFLED